MCQWSRKTVLACGSWLARAIHILVSQKRKRCFRVPSERKASNQPSRPPGRSPASLLQKFIWTIELILESLLQEIVWPIHRVTITGTMVLCFLDFDVTFVGRSESES